MYKKLRGSQRPIKVETVRRGGGCRPSPWTKEAARSPSFLPDETEGKGTVVLCEGYGYVAGLQELSTTTHELRRIQESVDATAAAGTGSPSRKLRSKGDGSAPAFQETTQLAGSAPNVPIREAKTHPRFLTDSYTENIQSFATFSASWPLKVYGERGEGVETRGSQSRGVVYLGGRRCFVFVATPLVVSPRRDRPHP